jgi:hypothetical protein
MSSVGSLALEMTQKLDDPVVTRVPRIRRGGPLQYIEFIDMLLTIQRIGGQDFKGNKPPLTVRISPTRGVLVSVPDIMC